MIALRSYDAGSNSLAIINENADSELTESAARVSRTALLSGGVSIVHRGFDHGDRTFRIRADIDAETQAAIEAMRDDEVYLLADTNEGTFIVVIERFRCDNGSLELTLMVKERVSQ